MKRILMTLLLIAVAGAANAQDKPNVVAMTSVQSDEAMEPAAIIERTPAEKPKKKPKKKVNPHDRYPTN